MNLAEKQTVAAIARSLISWLTFCKDEEFVNLVLDCVVSADPTPLEVEYL